MINLMPDLAKKELRAARVNIFLLRYLGILFLAALFLTAVLFVSYVNIESTRVSAQQLIDLNDTKAEAYSATKAELDALNSSLASANTILDREVLYSKVLASLGQVMSDGTIINSLSLSSTSFGAPIEIKIFATSTDAIISLQNRFQTAAGFTNVSFQSISGEGGISGYPASATITLTIQKDQLQ